MIYVCKTWLDKYGEAFEAAKRLALIEEAACNTQFGPNSEVAKLIGDSLASGTITAGEAQELLGRLANQLKNCIDRAWATVLKFVEDAEQFVDRAMDGVGGIVIPTSREY